MLELQKIFLIVKFFNRIFCNKGSKAKISCFFSCFFVFNSHEAGMVQNQKDGFVPDITGIGWRNTNICIHETSRMEWKPGNCWNSQLFEGKFLFLLVIWVKWKQSVCSIILLWCITFYSLYLPFFVLEIFKGHCSHPHCHKNHPMDVGGYLLKWCGHLFHGNLSLF